LEGDLEYARLDVVDLEDARQEARADLADGRAHGMTGLAVKIPEHDRAGFGLVALDAELGDALLDLLARAPGQRETGDIALDVGHENRHAQAREALGQNHQRHGLAGAGGARHQTVAVAVPGQQRDRVLPLADEDLVHTPRYSRPSVLRSKTSSGLTVRGRIF